MWACQSPQGSSSRGVGRRHHIGRRGRSRLVGAKRAGGAQAGLVEQWLRNAGQCIGCHWRVHAPATQRINARKNGALIAAAAQGTQAGIGGRGTHRGSECRPMKKAPQASLGAFAALGAARCQAAALTFRRDRKSTRLNSSHSQISYAVFCLKKKKKN